MKLNYKKLGGYVKPVDIRNIEGIMENLLGVSVQKKFIPSIANTVGTDFSKYKVVKQGQFTYIADTSRRGDKIGIALLQKHEQGLVSSSYSVFEVIDKSKLNPEYLMMWFRRPEFDRYARYKSHGSVREIFDWDTMCNIELPIPSIEKQNAIVKAYKIVTDRIEIKKKINAKLIDLGTSIIDSLIKRQGISNVIEKDNNSIAIPLRCLSKPIKQYCKEMKSGSTPSRITNDYWIKGTINWLKSGEVHNNITLQTEEKITKQAYRESPVKLLPKDTVLMAMYGATAGEVGYLAIESTTNQAICSMICHHTYESAYLYFALIKQQNFISRLATGGAQENLSKDFIGNLYIFYPVIEVLQKLGLEKIVLSLITNTKNIQKSTEVLEVLLSKLSH